MPAHGNLYVVIHAVEILDPCGQERFRAFGVGDLGFAASGKLKTLWRMLVYKLLLGVSQEGSGVGQDRGVFDVAVAGGAIADEKDRMAPLVIPECRQGLLGEHS